MDEDFLKIKRDAVSFSNLDDNKSDKSYWLSKSAEERLLAVELLRILMYGYDPTTERLQRVFETAEFKTS